jgi:cellulose synthase/poly-beta-1,6-N-acetylglucosamine synthase-like glycosyltransferase
MLAAAFWGFVAIVAYSYVGYPLILLLLARLRPAPQVTRARVNPRVSVVIVAHNEQNTIAARLENLLSADYPPHSLEIIVASDGSTDDTDAVVRSFASRGVRLIPIEGPRGKAHALNRVAQECTGEILVLADARQRFAPDALQELVSNFADPTVGVVSGQLQLESTPGSPEGVGFYWRYEKLIRRAESQVGSVVGATGAIYALRRRLFVPLDPRTILDDVALPLAVANAGFRVLFEPRARAYDRLFSAPGREFRRKVRTLAGNYQLTVLYPTLLDPRKNRLFWQFASHKLSRLLVPWCLLGMLGTNAMLAAAASPASHLYRALLVGQLLFYALALLGGAMSRWRERLRLLSVPYALVLLNVAAAVALFGFLRQTEKAAWRRSP